MLRILLFLALFWACSAHGQTLQKCSGQGDAVAYRSGDCLAGERLVAVREAGSDPRSPRPKAQSTSEPPAIAGQRRQKAARSRSTGRSAPGRRKPGANACAKAREARDDFQRRRGIRITMAELSRWNHRVYDACK